MKFSSVCSFNAGLTGRLGAECEYFTLDPDRTGYVAVTPQLFCGDGAPLTEGHIKPELPIHQIEIATGICKNPTEIERDLKTRLREVEALGPRYGFILDTSPTPQFPFEVEVYPHKPRYLDIARRVPPERLRNGWITGLHLHYGCSGPDMAIELLNGVRPFLPAFVSLAARSPTSMGRTRGYASERVALYTGMQPDLVPPHITNVDHLDRIANERGFDKDPGSCWWGVRINKLGTLELRVCDMQEKPAHCAQLAALYSIICNQIRFGDRVVKRPMESGNIMSLIEEAARKPAVRKTYAHLINECADYAHGHGFGIEYRHLQDFKRRLGV